jgi:hypothetical protein
VHILLSSGRDRSALIKEYFNNRKRTKHVILKRLSVYLNQL